MSTYWKTDIQTVSTDKQTKILGNENRLEDNIQTVSTDWQTNILDNENRFED